MFDTVALTRLILHMLSESRLSELGFLVRYDRKTGSKIWVKNGSKGEKSPRLTFSKTPHGKWYLRVEVSIPAFLHGSNLKLPNKEDIKKFFRLLSDYVSNNSGVLFDAKSANVSRIDCTRDFCLGPANVVPMIRSLFDLQVPRMRRTLFNDTTAEFSNKGKNRAKSIKCYSKEHEIMAHKGSANDLSLANGILRLEVSHIKYHAIQRLVTKLDLMDRTAKVMLTSAVSEVVISEAMRFLPAIVIDYSDDTVLERLQKMYPAPTVMRLLGFLQYRHRFGQDFHQLPHLRCCKSTYYRNLSACLRAGVLGSE